MVLIFPQRVVLMNSTLRVQDWRGLAHIGRCVTYLGSRVLPLAHLRTYLSVSSSR